MSTPNLAGIVAAVEDAAFAARVKAAAFVLDLPFASEMVWHVATKVGVDATDEEILSALTPTNVTPEPAVPEPVVIVEPEEPELEVAEPVVTEPVKPGSRGSA